MTEVWEYLSNLFGPEILGAKIVAFILAVTTSTNPTGIMIEVSGRSLYVESYGAGPAIVFLNGGFSSTRQWEDFVTAFSDSYRVILIDSPGQGRSTLGEGPLSYERMASDIAEALRALEVGSAHFVGHSDGGVIALHYLNDREDIVKSATLIGTPYHINNYREGFLATDTTFNELEAHRGPIFEVIYNGIYAPVAPNPEDFPELVKRLKVTWLNEPVFTKQQMATFNRPVLIFKTEKDEFYPPEVFDDMAQAIPGAEVFYNPSATHMWPIDEPEESALAIRKFVDSVESAFTATRGANPMQEQE